jgi:hypothetical protein
MVRRWSLLTRTVPELTEHTKIHKRVNTAPGVVENGRAGRRHSNIRPRPGRNARVGAAPLNRE